MFLEVVLSFLWETFLQVVAELLFAVGLPGVGDGRDHRLNKVLAAVGVALIGGLAGLVTSIVWPTRFFEPVLPGASLLLSPLLSGFVMEGVGRWRERRQQTRSYIATYWGGALFAFAMASVRFLWVGVP